MHACRSTLEDPTKAGFAVAGREVVPDDRHSIEGALRRGILSAALVLTTGGTGVSPRDVTPEATRPLLEKELPGLCEAMRLASHASNPRSLLSRAVAGTCSSSVIVNLPGSPQGAVECLNVVLPALSHAIRLCRGGVKDCADDRANPERRGS